MVFDLQLSATGIQAIDEQHTQLLTCLDRLEYSVCRGSGFPAALDAMVSLLEYVRNHFSFEEAYLAFHAYPKLEEHIKEHEAISGELENFEQKMLRGEDIGASLVTLLRNWIVVHIGAEDAQYAEFFQGEADHKGDA